MKRDNIFFEWKVTTSKRINCGKCGGNVNNPDGFLVIKRIHNYPKNAEIIICWDCFIELIKAVREKRKTKRKRENEYKILTKKRILRELK